MNIKSDKGYVGMDVSVAVIVLLFLVPTIMGIMLSISSSKNTSKYQTEALNILVNTIETAKGINLWELTEQELLSQYSSGKTNITVNNATNSAIIKTDIASYKLEVDVRDYKEDNADVLQNMVKTVSATVTYKQNNEEKTIDLKTVVK